ncbi:hypothetical protein HRM2_26290 [Desulforapulum autotrophicum HRM2]|uniref:BACON domain-containing protein n=1 Tax=Desulforapulum autotrophicum (strain ATCC 43914 / DSM 3382 / VKM B-1955 / HRM2) TaxID=177437 RepID=C0QHY7_DESAH|nr:hypothetical protein HRM2_26290 [Desulforapulum autotrophicum HRM2]
MVDRPPILNVFPTELYFAEESNDTWVLPQKLTITNSSERAFYRVASSDVTWLLIVPDSGAIPVDVDVHMDLSAFSWNPYYGDHYCDIRCIYRPCYNINNP